MDTASTASLEADFTPEQSISRFRLTLLLLLGVVWLTDFLFWNLAPGLSLGLFAGAIALVVRFRFGRKDDRWQVKAALGLLFVAVLASAWQLSLSNGLVLLALLAVIVGESCFRETPGGPWARWSEALAAWVAAPGRWGWLIDRIYRDGRAVFGLAGSIGRWNRALRMIAPAALLTIGFALVFRSGNAVFGEVVQHCFDRLLDWLSNWDLTFLRIIFWGIAATGALAIVQPRRGASAIRLWARPLPRWMFKDQSVAWWQSLLILIALNGLFFTVNTIDVCYLWKHATLPAGVSFSQFVHEGVSSLITAVVLSAITLAAMFQQDTRVTSGATLRGLALLWTTQNLVLIFGVLLRLKLYVEQYQMSELRVYVACFLLLVSAGFLLLAWHVYRGEDLGCLVFRNVLATFALFFVLQFLDVAGWVARYNVAQWKASDAVYRDTKWQKFLNREPRVLDLNYLQSLGPGAWPSLVEVATMPKGNEAVRTEAARIVQKIATDEIDHWTWHDWRATQIYRENRSWQLIRGMSKSYPLVIDDRTIRAQMKDR